MSELSTSVQQLSDQQIAIKQQLEDQKSQLQSLQQSCVAKQITDRLAQQMDSQTDEVNQTQLKL